MPKNRLVRLAALLLVAFFTMAAVLEDCNATLIDSRLGETKFSDVEDGHAFYAGVRVAEHYGWMQGYPDGTLKPDERITAKQLAAMVERIYEDGMTRAEAATYLAEGSIALLEHSIEVETVEADNDILIVNQSSLAIDMSGWELDWGEIGAEDDTKHTYGEGFILRPFGRTNFSPPEGKVGSTNTLSNEFGITIASG